MIKRFSQVSDDGTTTLIEVSYETGTEVSAEGEEIVVTDKEWQKLQEQVVKKNYKTLMKNARKDDGNKSS